MQALQKGISTKVVGWLLQAHNDSWRHGHERHSKDKSFGLNHTVPDACLSSVLLEGG
jgi:hypothetical protein